MNANRNLRNLYATRAAVQLLWAATYLALAVKTPAFGAVMLVLYPLWDVASTIYDLRTNVGAASSTRSVQYANVLIGLATAVALAVFGLRNEAYTVASFGAWALAAGVLQLAVGVRRRSQTGGQWAMILSGAQSTLAGGAFILGGLGGKLHGKDLGGYAVFGAVYFLVAAVLLTRRLAKAPLAD